MDDRIHTIVKFLLDLFHEAKRRTNSLSMPKNRLLMQIYEGAPRIVFRLDLPVGFTVIDAPEFVFGEEGLRIERLAAAEFLHNAFDADIEMAGGPV